MNSIISRFHKATLRKTFVFPSLLLFLLLGIFYFWNHTLSNHIIQNRIVIINTAEVLQHTEPMPSNRTFTLGINRKNVVTDFEIQGSILNIKKSESATH